MTIPANPDADQALGEIARLVGIGDHARARQLCEQVLAQSPDDADALIWLGRIAMDDTLWAEAIAAATINGAWALRVAKRKGSIAPGKDADLAVFAVEDYREIPYWFGANHCAMSVLNGVAAPSP